MQMVFDSASTFELLRQCYQTGLLEDLVAVAGRTLDALVDETGLGMGELLGLLDSVPEEAVLAAEEKVAALDPGQLVSRLGDSFDGESRERMATKLTESLKRAVAAAQGGAAGAEGV
jgi:hypothetical protein